MAAIERKGKFYYVEGEKYVRVTNVLDVINKPQLITWAARSAAEVALADPSMSVERVVSEVFKKKEDAADIGTLVHKMISSANGYVENINSESIHPATAGRIKAFKNFCSALKPTTIASELECYSKEHKYAGTTDWIVRFPNNEVWLLDFKTGGIYDEAGLQMAAYKNALHEMIALGVISIPQIDRTAVVQLCPDGTFNLKIFDSPFEVFLAALKILQWK